MCVISIDLISDSEHFVSGGVGGMNIQRLQ